MRVAGVCLLTALLLVPSTVGAGRVRASISAPPAALAQGQTWSATVTMVYSTERFLPRILRIDPATGEVRVAAGR